MKTNPKFLLVFGCFLACLLTFNYEGEWSKDDSIVISANNIVSVEDLELTTISRVSIVDMVLGSESPSFDMIKETPVDKGSYVEVETKPSYDENNLYWLSRIISAEAKGECKDGQISVANVILNRVKSNKFPSTIEGVIFQRGQFSPVGSGSVYNRPTNNSVESAKSALDGVVVVPKDILYFYNSQITSRTNWIGYNKLDRKHSDMIS